MAIQNRFRPIGACLLVLLPLQAGCTGTTTTEMARVTGVIRLDSKPLDDVEIVLVPETNQGTAGPQASGFSDQAGRFQPQTSLDGATHDGVVVGRYRVALRDLKAVATSAPDPKAEYAGDTAERRGPKARFAPRFADTQSSPFGAVLIGPGAHELVLEVDSRAKAGRASIKSASNGHEG